MHTPLADDFASLAVEHDFVPVYRRLLSDTLTPVTAFRLLDDGGPCCLFESVIGGEKVGRYSFLAANPVRRFSAKREQIEVTEAADGSTTRTTATDPLDAFRSHFHYRVARPEGLPPFVGGAIGYAGYDVVRYVEKLPNSPQDDRDLPDLDFGFYHTLCVFDHVDKTITVVSLADCRQANKAEQANQAYAQATQQVDQTITKLSDSSRRSAGPDEWNPDEWKLQSQANPLEVTSNFTREAFESAVLECVEYIRAGTSSRSYRAKGCRSKPMSIHLKSIAH